MNQIKDNRAESEYIECRRKAVRCQIEACRSIWANLTEMSYCIDRERRCMNEYEKYLKNRKT